MVGASPERTTYVLLRSRKATKAPVHVDRVLGRRVPANQITGLDPGEIFVHRNVANLIVHSDLNALSAVQYAVSMLKVTHVMVVGHYGCGGVLAAHTDARVGLADNWIRHIRDVRQKHRRALECLAPYRQADALVDLNVIEQVMNLCGTTVLTDAWAGGQSVSVHGWAYSVGNGLLHDLEISIHGPAQIDAAYKQAVRRAIKSRAWELPLA